MIPTYDADLFTDDALAKPYEHHRTLRDLGPVVWLSAHDRYAVTRYADVRACSRTLTCSAPASASASTGARI